MRLYGREKIYSFVKAGLERPANPQVPPAMLLVGRCGSGKTVLLEQLEEEHRKDVPTARLDLARDQHATPVTVMLTIRKALSQRVARVGKIPFPLLQLGVCALSLDPHGGRSPEEQLKQRLSGRDKPGQQLLSAGARAARLLPPGQKTVVTEAAALARWVCSGISARQQEKHLSWYSATAAGQGDGTSYGPLIELHRKWQQASSTSGHPGQAAAAADLVWEVLCAALLADLRADFNETRLRHGRRTVNCLLLLDNTDTEAGQHFLTALNACRSARPGDAPLPADPLMLIAAQRSRPGPDLQTGEYCLATDDALEYGGWPEARRQRKQSPLWCPVRLTDLSADQVKDLVSGAALGQPWRDADFLQDLTGGHPAVTQYLAARLNEAPVGSGGRLVLAPADDGDLMKLMVPDGVTSEDLDQMAVCAATPGARGAACTSVFAYLSWDSGNVHRAREMLQALLWATEDADGLLTLDPLPRLLLTRRIARDEPLWNEVHHAYQSHYDGIRDGDLSHHHRLAGTSLTRRDGLQKVADYLDQKLTDVGPRAWNDTVAKVIDAPNRIATADVRNAVKDLAGNRDPQDQRQAITRLIAARWLTRDRLLDPAHSLASLVAQEYQDLDNLVKGNTEAFFQAASQFRRVARTWEGAQ